MFIVHCATPHKTHYLCPVEYLVTTSCYILSLDLLVGKKLININLTLFVLKFCYKVPKSPNNG